MKNILLLLVAATQVQAATYYIDFDSGNDTNAGTSTGSPWKTIPGSRNASDTADASTDWGSGTFNQFNKVPGGTTFLLKSGTTWNTNKGGKIYLSKDNLSGPPYLGFAYYGTDITTNNPVIFQRDVAWGTGPVVFDGTGAIFVDTSSSAYIYTRNVGGFVFDGVAGVNTPYDGIVIKNTYDTAFLFWMAAAVQGGSDSLIQGVKLQYITFTNCATKLTSLNGSWESHGAIVVTMDTGNGSDKTIDRVNINHVEINQAGLFGVGIRFGEQPGRIFNGTISDVLIHDSGHGDVSDSYKNGRGITTKNSNVIISNAITYNLIKGQDHSCPLVNPNSPWALSVVNINPVSYNNDLMGIGHNGPFGVFGSVIFTNVANYTVINGLIYDNKGPGVKSYSGPYNLTIVNSTFINNVDNLLANPSDTTDTNKINVVLYNNIFYKPNPLDGNVAEAYWTDTNTTFTWTADYNSYVATNAANASENFSQWSAYAGSAPHNPHNFLYGVNGPGQTSGTWYSFNSWHNDPHSIGTGSSVSTNSPQFASLGGRVLFLTSHYPGTNISGFPWYRTEMGIDKNGISRTSWDMGAYEYTTSFPKIIGTSIIGSSRF